MIAHNLEIERLTRSPGVTQLSVVIASNQSLRELDQCLHALQTHCVVAGIEIIVADSREDESVNDVMTKYPDVAFICFSTVLR